MRKKSCQVVNFIASENIFLKWRWSEDIFRWRETKKIHNQQISSKIIAKISSGIKEMILAGNLEHWNIRKDEQQKWYIFKSIFAIVWQLITHTHTHPLCSRIVGKHQSFTLSRAVGSAQWPLHCKFSEGEQDPKKDWAQNSYQFGRKGGQILLKFI